MVEQGVHRYVHEFCAIHHRSASGSGFSPLHESYGIHTLVLLTVLVHGLHVTNTAVGSFNRPFFITGTMDLGLLPHAKDHMTVGLNSLIWPGWESYPVPGTDCSVSA